MQVSGGASRVFAIALRRSVKVIPTGDALRKEGEGTCAICSVRYPGTSTHCLTSSIAVAVPTRRLGQNVDTLVNANKRSKADQTNSRIFSSQQHHDHVIESGAGRCMKKRHFQGFYSSFGNIVYLLLRRIAYGTPDHAGFPSRWVCGYHKRQWFVITLYSSDV